MLTEVLTENRNASRHPISFSLRSTIW